MRFQDLIHLERTVLIQSSIPRWFIKEVVMKVIVFKERYSPKLTRINNDYEPMTNCYFIATT